MNYIIVYTLQASFYAFGIGCHVVNLVLIHGGRKLLKTDFRNSHRERFKEVCIILIISGELSFSCKETFSWKDSKSILKILIIYVDFILSENLNTSMNILF